MKLFSTLPLLFVAPLLISVSSASLEAKMPTKDQVAQTISTRGGELVVQRKLRIERLLISLDKAAEVAVLMHPQNSERLEPIIVDLAEQTLNLVGASEIQNVKTDAELDRLELTVGQLVHAMSRMIEPEMSL